MSQDAILRLHQTRLFKVLLNKEEDDHQLTAKITEIVKVVAPLLQRVPENMPEYTLHDANHSSKIVELMGKIIPNDVLQNLNVIELSLLILSAYLHDIGMTCNKQEKENIINSDDDFLILFKSDTAKHRLYEQYKLNNNHRAATFVQDQIFTEYLRRNHVRRSANFITDNLNKGELALNYNGIPFYKHLIKICDSHGLPVKKIYDTHGWPRETLVGELIVNIQYLSVILRLADILDLDSERTPKVIYEFANPEDPISIIEWKKHRSIIGTSINEKKILFEAECSSPEVERALRQFIDWIEMERKESIQLLDTYKPEEKKKYYISLNESITKDRIQSDGSYIYSDLTFGVDFHRITELLMGEKLYKNPITAIREILQNSFDAIKARHKIYEKKLEKITPYIKIVLLDNILTVEDNGIGMDESIFKEYFLQLGKSYYSSSQFYSKFSGVDITSEFGIGILSAFMIATSLIIESRKEPEDPLNPFLPIYFEIPTAHGYLIQKESKKTEIGTKLTLKLKDNNPLRDNNIINILEQIVPNPTFPIFINNNGTEYKHESANNVIIPDVDFTKENAMEFLNKHQPHASSSEDRFTHSIFDIVFTSETDELKDIKGKLSIVNSVGLNYYSGVHGSVCQRDFSVGYPDTTENIFKISRTPAIKNLFPNWINCYSTLNFTEKSCLSITPDRTDLIIDEKFKRLKDKIEQKIIKEFTEHLDSFKNKNGADSLTIYIDFLFTAGFFGFDLREHSTISENALTFFRNYITFPVLTIDGKINRASVNKLLKQDNIGIIKNKLNTRQIEKLVEFKERNEIELIVISEFNFKFHRFDELVMLLLGYQKRILKPFRLNLKPLFASPIYIIKLKEQTASRIQDYDLIDSISNSDLIDNDLPVVFTFRSFPLYPQYNITHPLIHLIISRIPSEKEKEKVFRKLTSAIMKVIENSIRNSGHLILNELFIFSADYNLPFWGILNKDRELLGLLNSIFDEFWDNAKKSKIIDDAVIKPNLTPSDLPWFWSENEKDFESHK